MRSRRALLRGAGLVGLAGFAGCTNFDGGSTPTSAPANGSEPSDIEVPSDATHRVVSPTVDDAPSLPVHPRLSLADPFFTSGSPAVLRIDVGNPSDDSVTVGEYRDVVFQFVYSGDGAYLLLPHSERSTEREPDRRTPDYETEADCWRLTDRIGVTEEYGTVEIPSGGTLAAFVGLYGTVDASECLPTGESRFETMYVVDPLTDDDPRKATWGFTLVVESL